MEVYIEKKMEQLNSGESKTIFRNIFLYCHHWSEKVEEQYGRRRRKQEKIPVLYWFIRSNLVPPSSSRPFRTQFHWSNFTGQCCYSERLLPVHLSSRMCNQFTFHHKFRIDTGRTKFEQQTDSILPACGSHGRKNIRILIRSTWMHRVMHNTCIKHGRNITTRCIGSTSNWLKRKGLSSIKHDRKLSFFTKHSHLNVSRKLLWWKLEKPNTRKTSMRHLDVFRRFLFIDKWMKELGSEVAGGSEDSQQPNQNQKLNCWARWDLWRVVCQCLLNVEDKDADEHVDADQISTGRPVNGQSIGLFTQRDEIDIDFRVPGLSHAVVKQAENFRVRE